MSSGCFSWESPSENRSVSNQGARRSFRVKRIHPFKTPGLESVGGLLAG